MIKAYRLSGPLQPIVCGVHLRNGYRLAYTTQEHAGTRGGRDVVILYVGKNDDLSRWLRNTRDSGVAAGKGESASVFPAHCDHEWEFSVVRSRPRSEPGILHGRMGENEVSRARFRATFDREKTGFAKSLLISRF